MRAIANWAQYTQAPEEHPDGDAKFFFLLVALEIIHEASARGAIVVRDIAQQRIERRQLVSDPIPRERIQVFQQYSGDFLGVCKK